MDKKEIAIRKELVKYANKTLQKGLVSGAGGNISVRFKDKIFISPSGLSFEEISYKEYIAVDISTGRQLTRKGMLSSEVSVHLACYRTRKDISAVLHFHPLIATGIVTGGGEVTPMVPEGAAYLGREIPVLNYIIPTTEKMAKAVKKIVKIHNSLIIINHGAITLGTNLKEAYYRAELIEDIATIYFVAKIMGKPRKLTKREVEEIINLPAEKYRTALLKNKKGR